MPKIGPNKVSIDPKAYAARVTSAKKRVAQMDPATKAKLSEYFPKVTKAEAAKQALGVKKTTPEQKRMQAMPKVKITGTASTKPRVSASMSKSQPKTTAKTTPKAKPLTGPAAVAELQRQVSPAGVKKAEMNAKKAIAKKYPGLTKKSK
jgi:hypothetical protein